MEMTYHVSVTRADRVNHIVQEIGLGQVIKEKYVRYSIEQAGRWICITDTGVTIVKSEDKNTIITMYVTTQRELVSMYGGPKKVPTFLKKKVDYNQTKYVKGGKTIWH